MLELPSGRAQLHTLSTTVLSPLIEYGSDSFDLRHSSKQNPERTPMQASG